MSLTFYWYPKCGTCRKAKKWLEEHGKEINEIHIAERAAKQRRIKSAL
nr:glutaredoxin domain-containing protein [Bacillus subtilis]